MNSPNLAYSKIKINFVISRYNNNYNSTKLLTTLLLNSKLTSKCNNASSINKKITYLRILPLLNTLSLKKDLPKLENVATFITKPNVLESYIDAYYNIFNFFFSIGISKKKLLLLDTFGPMCRLINVLNWFLSSTVGSTKFSHNKVSYKTFKKKKTLRNVPKDTDCVVILPGLKSSLKKTTLRLRTPYVVYIGDPLTHRGKKIKQESSLNHINLVSHLYFFFKRGLSFYISKKLYKLLTLRVKCAL